jgi:hypothetical protein
MTLRRIARRRPEPDLDRTESDLIKEAPRRAHFSAEAVELILKQDYVGGRGALLHWGENRKGGIR